jgi:predicted regulator of Ras-like GTPase activity (Roadblock/LC7/MglB family)
MMASPVFASQADLDRQLGELVRSCEAITALLITREGICLSRAGHTDGMNSTALAALVAGMFAATKEVASMVGERQFSILLQQGERRHIHISLVGRNTMMVVVFEDYTRIGRVRLEARKYGEKLAELLDTERPQDMKGDGLPDLSLPRFKEYALNLIDRIFDVSGDEDATH